MARENPIDLFRNWLGLVDAESLASELTEIVEHAERSILRHQPTSNAEALMVSEILLDNLRTGGRPDGLDLIALQNLQGWISRDLPGAKRGIRRYARLALVA